MMIFTLFVLALGLRLEAQEPAVAEEPSDGYSVLAPVRVIEGREVLDQVTASHKLRPGALQEQKTTDVHRALKQLPGVQVQEEDGMGLRPNIGLRGTHPHRSRKVVLMEDGILIGPAPYAAPAAYYSPSMLHVENLEIFKGLSALQYGPNSIGGAVNYLSRSIPDGPRSKAEFAAGSFGSRIYLIETGKSSPEGLGGLLNASHATSSGFKKLPDGGPTGFSKNDLLLKTRWILPGDQASQVGLKIGYSDEKSDETYLGLTDRDFAEDPFQRYAASSRDQMRWRHVRVQADYQRAVGPGTFRTSLYHHEFHRNWERFNGFRDANLNINEILRNPTAGNEPAYRILTGEEDSSSLGVGGDLAIVQNDRKFFSQGWQTELWREFGEGETVHSVTALVRLHRDQIRRNHRLDYYSMSQGALERVTPSSLTSALNRDQATARSLGLQDEIRSGDWRYLLAARFEDVHYDVEDDLAGTARNRDVQGFAPGVGVARKITPSWTLAANVSRGLTLVGTNAADDEGPEESVNYELVSRYLDDERELQLEIGTFYNDYRNIKGTCSFAGGCVNDALDTEFSGGKAKVIGIETRFAKGIRWNRWTFPVRANLTWLQARFAEDSVTRNPEWGVDPTTGEGQVRSGDPLPYIPGFQGSVSVGAETGRWKQELIAHYTGRVYDQAVQEGRSELPAYGVLDWHGRLAYSKSGFVFAKADNILGRKYAVSWRPFGLRPGKPQSFMIGIEHVF